MSIFNKAWKLNMAFGMRFENRLFTYAEHFTPDYANGQWKSAKAGRFDYAVLPGKGDVTVTNPDNGASETCDRHTAGAALTVLAFNGTIWSLHADFPDSPIIGKLSDYNYALIDAIRSDKRVNQKAFNALID